MLYWENLPSDIKNEAVLPYYEILKKKSFDLAIKRIFDIMFSLFLLILFFVPMLFIAIFIKIDSPGPVFFRQKRVTIYGKTFRIFKFRSMVENAHSLGLKLTCKDDERVTRLGRFIRKTRLDEVPQLINILKGEMSFVGTRPETENYVNVYKDEMLATLLMPAGVTSLASIKFKDESDIIGKGENADKKYVEIILPEKMKYNLEYIEKFNFFYDLNIIFKTILAVVRN